MLSDKRFRVGSWRRKKIKKSYFLITKKDFRCVNFSQVELDFRVFCLSLECRDGDESVDCFIQQKNLKVIKSIEDRLVGQCPPTFPSVSLCIRKFIKENKKM